MAAYIRTLALVAVLIVAAPDLTFISRGGAAAEFTVRLGTLGVNPAWQIVEWRDLQVTGISAVAGAVEETTWGKVKALYLSPSQL